MEELLPLTVGEPESEALRAVRLADALALLAPDTVAEMDAVADAASAAALGNMDSDGEGEADASTGPLPEVVNELLCVAVIDTDGDIVDVLCPTDADGVAVAGSGAMHDKSVTAPAEPARQSVPPPPI